jgi:spermidine/putrescine-binding protein
LGSWREWKNSQISTGENEIYDYNIDLKCDVMQMIQQCYQNNKQDRITEILQNYDRHIFPMTGLRLFDDSPTDGMYLQVRDKVIQKLQKFKPNTLFAKNNKLELKFLNNFGVFPSEIRWKKDKPISWMYDIINLEKFGIAKYPEKKLHNPIDEVLYFFQQCKKLNVFK